MSLWKKRQDGGENPAIHLGTFKLRLPFIHYRFEWPDYFQGLLMCAVDLAAIPLLIELLGMPFEAALAIVSLFTPCVAVYFFFVYRFSSDMHVHMCS